MKITNELLEQIKLLYAPIERLGLGVRAYNALNRVGVRNVFDLLVLFPDDIENIRNLGEKGIRDVKRTLKDYGIDVEALKDETTAD